MLCSFACSTLHPTKFLDRNLLPPINPQYNSRPNGQHNRYTAAHFFTEVKPSIAAFRPHRTRRSVTATQWEKKAGINITPSFILNWGRNLCAFTLPFLNGIFNSYKYTCLNFLCSCNNFS